MRQRVKKYLQIGLGYGLLALGVAGLFLPILQGILFIMLGLLVLSYHQPWAERLLARLRKRFPKHHDGMHRVAHRWKEKAYAWWYGPAEAHDCEADPPPKPGEDEAL